MLKAEAFTFNLLKKSSGSLDLKLSDAKSYTEQLLAENSLRGTEEVRQRLAGRIFFNKTRR
jgi:hypothetical protein